MRLFACLPALLLAPTAWAQSAPPAPANVPGVACRPLLSLVAAGSGSPVVLGTCDLDVLVGDGGAGAGLALRPRGSALEAVADALAPRGRFFGPMLEARLRVEPTAASADLRGFPGGVLLASESARLLTEGHWRWVRSERLLRWVPPRATDASAQPECRALAGQHIVLWAGSLDRQPGDIIAAQPWVPGHAPGFARAVPRSCIGTWSLGADAPAAIDPQTGVVVLRPLGTNASPHPFTVVAQVAGRPVEGRVASFDAGRQPLVGDWVLQQPSGCDGAATAATARFKLVEFTAEGSFRARAAPFEARYDAWGRYSLDRATGRFALRVEGGNDTGGVQEVAGTATVREDGRVVLADLAVTPGTAASACSWTFGPAR